MDQDSFDLVVAEILGRVEANLTGKGAEYVPESNTPGVKPSRFHNFEVAAALNGTSEEQALWGMLTKHIVSLSDMVKVGSIHHNLATWDEKIGDALTYLVLLRGIVASKVEGVNIVYHADNHPSNTPTFLERARIADAQG